MSIAKLNKIKILNDKLNTYDYGIFIDGIVMTKDVDFDLYKTISPENFEKYKVGVCWDYVEYEAIQFKKFGMRLTTQKLSENSFSLFYMQHLDQKDICPTHTWIGFMLNNQVYAFESSWTLYQGITPFDSEFDMILEYDKRQRNYWEKQNNNLSKVLCIKYRPFTKYDLTPEDYMNTIYKQRENCIYSTFKEFPVKIKI